MHCFGYHSKCSIDFCTTAKKLTQLTDQSNTHISSGNDDNSSGSSYTMDSSNEEDISSSVSTDISMDQQDDLEDVVMQMQQEWNAIFLTAYLIVVKLSLLTYLTFSVHNR